MDILHSARTYIWSLIVLNLFRLCTGIRLPRNCEFDCSYKADTKRLMCEGRDISCIPTPCCLQATRTLNLANNNIDVLSQNAFYKFPNLRSLDLRDNNINHIAPGAFIGLMSLTTLDLSANNLNRLKAGCFSGMPNLRHLNLEDNSIFKVDAGAFVGLPMLMYINMNDNELRSMHPGMFEPLRNLLELHLDNNQINAMFDGALYGLKRLKVISLSENELRTLPDLISSIPNLRTATIDGNPLVCDCHLEHLRRWFVLARRLDSSLSFPSCARPLRLSGRDISTLNFPLICWDHIAPDQSEESVAPKPTQAIVDLPVYSAGGGGAGKVEPPPRGGILGNDLPLPGGNGPPRGDVGHGRPTVSGTGQSDGRPTIHNGGSAGRGRPTTYPGGSNSGNHPTLPGTNIDGTTLPRSTAKPRITEPGRHRPTEGASAGASKTTETPINPSAPSGTNQGLVLSFDGLPPVLHPDYEISFDGALPGITVPANSAPIDERPTSGNPADKYPSKDSPPNVNPTTEEPTNGHPSKESPASVDPNNELPTNEKPTEEHPSRGNPTDGSESGKPTPGGGRPSGGDPSSGNGRPSGGDPSSGNGRPIDGTPSEGSPTTGHGRPFDGNPTSDNGNGGRPTTGGGGRPSNGNPTFGNGRPTTGNEPSNGNPSYGNERPVDGNPSPGNGRPLDGNPSSGNGRPFDGNPSSGNGNPLDGTPTSGNERPTTGHGPGLDGNPDVLNPSNNNPTDGHHNNGRPFDGNPSADNPNNGNPMPPNTPTHDTAGNGFPHNTDPSFGYPGNELPWTPNGKPHDPSLPGLPTPDILPAGTPPETWGLKGSKMFLDCGQEARQTARSGSRVKWLTPSGGVVNHMARGRFVVAANGSLVVSKLQSADTGAYRCIIRNDTTTRISLIRLQVACPCGITAKAGNQFPDMGFGTTINPPGATPETRPTRSCNITPVVVAIVTTFQATVALCSIVFCAWYSRCGNREQWKSRVNAAEQHSNVNTVDKAKEASLPSSWRSHSYEAVCSSLGSRSSQSTSPTDSISSSSCDQINNLNEYVNSNVMRHYSEDYVDLDPQSRTIDDTYSSLTRQSRRAAAAAVANRNKHKCVETVETVTG